MRRAERQRASRRSRLSLHASGEFRLELREVLLTPRLVFVVHLVRVPLPAVEDAAEFGLVVERIHELAVHDPAAEVPRAAELVHEIGLVRVQVVDGLGEQRDELGLRLPEGEMPAAVQIRHSVQFGVPERFPVVFLVPGDDVPVEPPVVALCLPARVVHARTDRRELDRATHHLAGAIPEAAEEIENHAPVAVVVFEAVAFRVVPGVEVAVVDAVFPEVRVGLVGVTGRTVALLNDLLHPVAKPPGKGERGDDAADLVLRVVVLVVAVRGVVSVGHDAVADHQQVSLNPYEYVAVDVFNHDLVGVSALRAPLREPLPRGTKRRRLRTRRTSHRPPFGRCERSRGRLGASFALLRDARVRVGVDLPLQFFLLRSDDLVAELDEELLGSLDVEGHLGFKPGEPESQSHERVAVRLPRFEFP